MTLIQKMMRYLSEAVVRIFAPYDDHYPATGVVPFQGDFYTQSLWAD